MMVSKSCNPNGFQPRVVQLEDRIQPGSVITGGLDMTFLAGALLGDNLLTGSVEVPAVIGQASSESDTKVMDNAVETGALAVSTQPKLSDGTYVPPVQTDLTVSDIVGHGSPQLDRPGEMDTRANEYFYGGDYDGRDGLANEFNTLVSDARTFDDVRIRSQWVIGSLSSRNFASTTVTTANVTILGPGQAQPGQVNCGLPVAYSRTAMPATHTLIDIGFYETTVKVAPFSLPQGHYYINVQPIGNGTGRSFQATTSGANGKGSPIANDNTWFDSPFYGVVCQDAGNYLGSGTWDFSGGIGM